MSDLLEQGADFLAEQHKLHASKSVLYSRTGPGSGATTVFATVGRTEWEQTDSDGFTTRSESRDFIIKSSDLVIGGVNVEPKDGDEIRETFGQVTLVYRVVAPGGEPSWRYADLHRKSLRIHTTHIGEE